MSVGYLPAELPPPFNSLDCGRHSVALASAFDESAVLRNWTAPELYNAPRYGQARRRLSIVNPVNQILVASLLASNWDAVTTRISRSTASEFSPQISSGGTGRAVSGIDFDGVTRRRTYILGKYGRYVKTDVARFYPSIYTHSIAWSLLGKEWVKTNYRHRAFRESFANRLDKAISAGQSGQTVGIPIGPDTSRIVSELIAAEVEQGIISRLSDYNERSVRYVDDMLIGIGETETPEAILSCVSSALYEYELELSAEKTGVFGLGQPHAPEWTHYIRSFTLNESRRLQIDEIDAFFEQSLYLSDLHSKENVLLFAVKRAASFDVNVANREHLFRWMLYCARRSTTCLSFVVEHLSSTERNGEPTLPHDEISEFIHNQISIRALAAHTHECVWLIFWALELGLQIRSEALEAVAALRSGACAVVTADLIQRRQVRGNLDISDWRSQATADGLKGEMWLATYEVTRRGWWPRRRSDAFIRDHDFFGELARRNISFYDTRRRSRAGRSQVFFSRLGATAFGGGAGYPD